MADNDTPQAGTTATTQAVVAEPAPQQAATPNTPATTQAVAPDTIDSLPEWAQKEIRSLRKEAEGYRKAKSAAERQAQEASEAIAREQGKWQELYEKAQPRAKQADEYEAFLTELLESELKAIPERLRGLVPDMAPLAKLRWVQQAKAAGILAAPAPAQTDARDNPQRQAQAKGALTDEGRRELAAIYGVDPKYLPPQL
jgi:hypothetical protein